MSQFLSCPSGSVIRNSKFLFKLPEYCGDKTLVSFLLPSGKICVSVHTLGGRKKYSASKFVLACPLDEVHGHVSLDREGSKHVMEKRA